MPLEGRIDLGGMVYPCPSGMEFTIAVDGTHHVVARTGSDDFLVLSCVETLTYASTTVDFATFKADVIAELGLGDGGGGTQNISADERVNIRGTPYVVILGDKERVGFAGYEVYNIIYRVLSEGNTEIAFVQHYLADFPPLNWGGWGGGIGVLTASDGEHFFYLGGFHDGSGIRAELVKLPLDDEIDLTADSFAGKRYHLPAGDMTSTGWWGTSSRDPKNHATLHEVEPDLISVMAYRTTQEGESSTKLWQTIVSTSGLGPGTGGTGKNDISALFSIPWADEGFDFDGDPSVAGDDKYTNPSINALPDGRIEIIFGRGDSALPGRIGYRQFICNPDLSGMVAFPLVWVDIGSALGVTGTEAVHFTREGDDLIPMIRENPAVTFGELLSPITEGGDDCAGEDVADEIAEADITWPECVLVPQDIDVQQIIQSTSPGHSLTMREQVLQADAGHWRIELMGIKVWTKAELLLWREIESTLGGRVGVALVPFYEAPLSGTPIVATAAQDHDIGAVRFFLEQTAGADIRPGMHFSIGDWGYRIVRVFGTALGVMSVMIWPPLRADVAEDEDLEFNMPRVRCRLERDDGMNINLEHLKFAKPSVIFTEDV